MWYFFEEFRVLSGRLGDRTLTPDQGRGEVWQDLEFFAVETQVEDFLR